MCVCVGHNPGIEAMVSTLIETSVHMPTAAIAVVELKLADWSTFEVSGLNRDWKFWRPKDLPDAGPDLSSD